MQVSLIKTEIPRTEVRFLHSLIISSGNLFGLAMVLAALALVIYLEVTLINISRNVSESSLVEYVQEGYFIITELFTPLLSKGSSL